MEGTRILHYDVLRLLGRGGMGEVYEALDTRLQRRVALKFIAPELAADADSLRRFEREALSVAQLSHPHIATLYALEHADQRFFISMELMSGESLRDLVATGPLPAGEALRIARDVAGALAHAHRRGVVHRDIKPENLMFDLEGAVKVTDFGLARAAQASRLTMTGTMMGTAAYMAPESTRGTTGPPADVFALGVTLYEMLAGVLPFPGENPMALLYMIANEEPRPLGEARPGLDEGIEALVNRMMLKDPAQRCDAAGAARELSRMTGVAPPATEPPLPAPIGGAGPLSSRTEELEAVRLPASDGGALVPAGKDRPRFPAWTLYTALALAVALGGGFGAKALFRGGGPGSDRTLQAKALSDDAAILLRNGQPDSARVRAEAALRLDPANAPARLNLGQALRQLGQSTRAAGLFAQVLRESPRDAKTRALASAGLADIAMDDETWPQAVHYWQESFALDPGEYTYIQLGYSLVRAARPQEALALLRRGLLAYPGSWGMHKNAGYALLALDSLDAARAEVDQALALKSDFGPALGLRARLAARAGDRATALADRAAFLRSGAPPADLAEVDADLRAAGMLR